MSGTRNVLQILPLNQGNNRYSFRAGIPQITFEIPKTLKILNGKSLRINGTMNVYLGDDSRPQNRMQTDSSANDGQSAQIDCRSGMSSVIDYVQIQNLNGQTYEFNKSYNRLAQAIMPTSESFTSYSSAGMTATFGAAGKNKGQGRMCERPFSFSLPLLSGFLQGTSGIDLQLVQGLLITVQLQSPENCLQNNFWHSSETDVNAVTILGSGAYYEITDVLLSAEVEIPSPQGRQAMLNNSRGSWAYDAYNSFYTTLASADHSALLNINTRQTKAIVANMIPSTFLNNYNYPSGLCTQLLETSTSAAGPIPASSPKLTDGVTQKFYVFTRGGLRVPLDFELRSENTQEEGTPDSHKNYTELNTLREVWNLSNFLKSTRTELSLPHKDSLGARVPPAFDYNNNRLNETLQDAEQQYLIGVNYDHISNLGISFVGTPVGVRIVSSLSANTPHSIFLFVKHQNVIALDNGRVSIIE